MGLLLFPWGIIENKIPLKKLMVHLCDLGLGNDFFDVTPKAQATNEEINWTLFLKDFVFQRP